MKVFLVMWMDEAAELPYAWGASSNEEQAEAIAAEEMSKLPQDSSRGKLTRVTRTLDVNPSQF